MLKWISLLVLFLASLLISTHACPVLGLLLAVLTPSNVRFVSFLFPFLFMFRCSSRCRRLFAKSRSSKNGLFCHSCCKMR
ncbi:hypothetical protein BKA59DRAFT_107891 [Fusarium tricinctum]|uniref:Secreted protein n=1 Tax=Fusarium tricinctum TaxID=61284 RepID=A0A8K0WFM5_9HYPO|nr:hypothetical protein BKA59DRAFT_107891 [Fusarium tricinctum]